MTRSELIDSLQARLNHYKRDDIELAVTTILEAITKALVSGDRLEIRGFGSFSTQIRAARTGRNPATGELVQVPAKRVAHFKPGVDLRERVQAATMHKIGRAALDNPDLPISFIADSLASMAEPRHQATPFVPQTRRKP